MTLYEKEDDFGLDGTKVSLLWGSAGRPIACCNIRRYKIWKPNSIKDNGRGLQDEDG
jgi:hypothetical protein